MKKTVTETKRRLRQATRLVREVRGFPSNWRVEIGTRILPVHVRGHVPTSDEVWARDEDGDDLNDYLGIGDLVASDVDSGIYGQIFTTGYIAHLYFSSTGDYGELEDIVVVWLGDETHEPAVIE